MRVGPDIILIFLLFLTNLYIRFDISCALSPELVSVLGWEILQKILKVPYIFLRRGIVIYKKDGKISKLITFHLNPLVF